MKKIRFLLSLFTAGSEVAAQSADPNDKEVLIRGWKDEEVFRIIGDFRATYRDRLAADFAMAVQLMPDGVIRITFPSDIPAPLFVWLVNYVRYPKDFDLSARSILVFARTTLSSAFEPAEKELIGQRAVFYVPRDDREYDLVFVRVAAVTYELSFARGAWRVMKDERMPPGLDALMKKELNQSTLPTSGLRPAAADL